MNNPVYKMIRKELDHLGRTDSDLQVYLTANGADLPLMMVDMWSTDDDLRMIAAYLNILPSVLITLKGDNRATAAAIFEEIWDNFAPRLGISKQQAWDTIESLSEFRSGHLETLRSEIAQVLDALIPPFSFQSDCYFLDCPFRCVTKCRRTGRQPGA